MSRLTLGFSSLITLISVQSWLEHSKLDSPPHSPGQTAQKKKEVEVRQEAK